MALQDLEFRPLYQGAIDLTPAPELVTHTIVLLAPVCRHVVPGVEVLARCLIAAPISGQVTLQLRLGGVNRDHIERGVVIIASGFRRVDLKQNKHWRTS
jgi:hypothetical protein